MDEYELFKAAIEKDDIKAVERLLDEGADVDVRSVHGETPLHLAAIERRKKIAELLISRGADVNVRDAMEGNTPLHWATQKGDIDVVKLLIDKGADVNVKKYCHTTPLHDAVKEGHKEIVELLIGRGADVNAKITSTGSTPLHKAAGNKEVVELLINAGADVNAKDGYHYTLLHWAAINGHKEIVELLINRGGDVNVEDRDHCGWLILDQVADDGIRQILMEAMKRDPPGAADITKHKKGQPQKVLHLGSKKRAVKA